jgi:SAM-dependent methyltransferase
MLPVVMLPVPAWLMTLLGFCVRRPRVSSSAVCRLAWGFLAQSAKRGVRHPALEGIVAQPRESSMETFRAMIGQMIGRRPENVRDDGHGAFMVSQVMNWMKKLLQAAVSAAERLRMWLLGQSWFQSVLMPVLPRQLRWLLRKVYLAPIDLGDRLLGRRDPGTPAKAQNFTGSAGPDFASRGDALVEALAGLAGATPSSHILDVGCGVGKLAIPMTRFLDANGRYEGLDIVPDAIEWCKRQIVGPHGNVHFTLADVYNKEYNPRGRVQPTDYRFPYDDGTFDVVALYSVFTHMLPDDVDWYVSEIARVLRANGHIFATYFVINPESLRLMRSSGCAMQFKRNLGPHWIQSGRVPELAVAYNEDYVREVYVKHGLSLPKIYDGAWCGRAGHWPGGSGFGDQDVIVARKIE